MDQQTIIRLLDRVREMAEADLQPYSDVIHALSLRGLQSAVDLEAASRDDAALELELDYLEVDKSQNGLQNCISEWMKRLNFYHARRARILRYQSRYNISGLVEGSTTLGDLTMYHLVPHEDLVPTPADLIALNDIKRPLAQFWAGFVRSKGLKVYRATPEDGWIEFDLDSPMFDLVLSEYQWAEAWQVPSYYISPSRLRQNGFDEERQQPVYPDDELHMEVGLCLGRGTDMLAANNQIVLIARNF